MSVDSNSKSEDTSLDCSDLSYDQVNRILHWHKQQQIKLIERIEGEVIGKDDTAVSMGLGGMVVNEAKGESTPKPVKHRNNLRAEQREAINNIKESLDE